MLSALLYLGIAVATSLAFVFFKFVYRGKRENEPPVVPGHWFYGNGTDFQTGPIKFLNEARKKFGEILTVRLLNKSWSLFLDVHDFERFHSEKNFDFETIKHMITTNVFNFKIDHFEEIVKTATQKVNGKYLLTFMESFSKNLHLTMKNTYNEDDASSSGQIKAPVQIMRNNLSKMPADLNIDQLMQNDPKLMDDINDGWKEGNLRDMTSKIFFSSLFYTVFGHGKPGVKSTFEAVNFQQNMDRFHKRFNVLWFGMPIWLFPEAKKAAGVLSTQPTAKEMIQREGVSDYIKYMATMLMEKGSSEDLLIGLNLEFLHVSFNTFRVSIWCLYKLMEDEKALAAVRKDVDEAIEAKRSGDHSDNAIDFTLDELDKMPMLDSFVKEILRWSSGVYMSRYVSKDTPFKTHEGRTVNIRKGDLISFVIPAVHRDPEIFDKPTEFIYDRWANNAQFYKKGKLVKNPLLAFGKMCPAQKLAITEIKWFVINMITTFKMELVEGESTFPDPATYGNEITTPKHDVRMRLKEKEGAYQLNFINSVSA